METLTYELIDNRWHFSDGTSLPVVSGSSDMGDLAPAGDPAPAPEPAAAVDPAPSGDPTPAADPTSADVDPFEADPALDAFPRSYVEKLRQEAAARRTEAQAFKEAFDGYSDDDREVLLDLAKTLRTDPASAAEWMRAQAEALLAGDDPAGPEGEGAGEGIDPDAPLTAAQLDKYLADRDSKKAAEAAEAKALAEVQDEAKTLGFNPEAKTGPERRQYLELLEAAHSEHGGDLAKAATAIKAERQKIIDDWLAGKAAQSDATPTTPSQAGGGREPFEAPKDWDGLKNLFR